VAGDESQPNPAGLKARSLISRVAMDFMVASASCRCSPRHHWQDANATFSPAYEPVRVSARTGFILPFIRVDPWLKFLFLVIDKFIEELDERGF
jgi:hypothetical protein